MSPHQVHPLHGVHALNGQGPGVCQTPMGYSLWLTHPLGYYPSMNLGPVVYQHWQTPKGSSHYGLSPTRYMPFLDIGLGVCSSGGEGNTDYPPTK